MSSFANTATEETVGVKFAKDGPSIPVELLQSLENGDLVVFVGAGVSRRLGLPDFRGLVEVVCAHLGRSMSPDEQATFATGAFDVTLGLIESRIGKSALRAAIRAVLDVRPGADLSTHEALLQLATTKKGQLRLVTTNFDAAFALAHFTGSRTFDYAPYLPVPGRGWNSIVHLHGGLNNQQDSRGASLVLTSADFGRAYITEAWASRFLTELFRRVPAVLFVGYSVGDPAVRYILDAFAADRAHQEYRVAKAFLFAGAPADQKIQTERTWRSRGIEPIIYDQRDDHRLLHETLQQCAKRYRSGFFDRDTIILEYAAHGPLGGLDEEAVSQIVWALRDESGHSARRFAELRPPLTWLDTLESAGLLSGVIQVPDAVPLVTRVPTSLLAPALHPVAAGLCTWLCAHLDAPQLLAWIIKRGMHLHPDFAAEVRKWVADEAHPLPKGASLVWEFLAAQEAPLHSPAVDHHVTLNYRVIREGRWNPLLHDRVLSWLAPTIQFKEPFRMFDTEEVDRALVDSYVEVKLVPAAGENIWELGQFLLARPDAERVSQELLGDLTSILHRGLTYLESLQKIHQDYDWTFIERPAIDEHSQNNRFSAWTGYIELLRQCWERTAAVDPTRARQEVERWMRMPYPLFRRFVLWSAGRTGGMSPHAAVAYLKTSPPSTLWGLDCRRELFQCLTRIGPHLSTRAAQGLARVMCKGPPRTQYRDDLSDEEFLESKQREIYLRFQRLEDSGLTLPSSAKKALRGILEHHPDWLRATTERDEFASWMGDAHWGPLLDGVPQRNDYQQWTDNQVIQDLRANGSSPETGARWRWLLNEDPRRAIEILDALGDHQVFDTGIWELALNYLVAEPTRAECVRLFATFGLRIGPTFLADHLQMLTGVVELYCRAKADTQDDALWRLWDLLVAPAAERPIGEGANPVSRALGSPIGSLTEALLAKLGDLRPETYEAIPSAMRDRLEMLLNGLPPAHRLARLLLAKALAWMYRLRPELVVPTFVAHFDWTSSGEAQYVWLGFLMSPRIVPELWLLLRPFFLQTIARSRELGEYETQLYAVFAFILLHEEFLLEAPAARHALTVGTSQGRQHVAWYWWRQTDSATNYGENLFRDRLKYLLAAVWPIELELREEGSSEHLTRLAACCGAEFPAAVATIKPLITAVKDIHTFLWWFNQKDHAEKYPAATLDLLDTVIQGDIEVWGIPELRTVLKRIVDHQSHLAGDPRYLRLNAILQKLD